MSADPPAVAAAAAAAVMRCGALDPAAIAALAARFGAEAVALPRHRTIPGTFWGAPEAGLQARRVFYRGDTPVHSLLHELCHFVCMSPLRRAGLDTDAGGGDDEECAVCYLQVLLASRLEPYTAERCLGDMDAWGYSFREGAARAWFRGDGRDAREWLVAQRLIDAGGEPTWVLRGEAD